MKVLLIVAAVLGVAFATPSVYHGGISRGYGMGGYGLGMGGYGMGGYGMGMGGHGMGGYGMGGYGMGGYGMGGYGGGMIYPMHGGFGGMGGYSGMLGGYGGGYGMAYPMSYGGYGGGYGGLYGGGFGGGYGGYSSKNCYSVSINIRAIRVCLTSVMYTTVQIVKPMLLHVQGKLNVNLMNEPRFTL